MNLLKAWLLRWGPAVVMMALIFTASGTPGNELPKFGVWDVFVKKGGHIIGYALLAASYLRGLSSGKSANRRMLVLAIVLSGLYAASDEFHQSFTPGRTPSAVDVGIDTIGAALGAGTWAWMKSLLGFPK
jgi:VanZ family protein